MKTRRHAALGALLALAFAPSLAGAMQAVTLREEMRRLWAEHVVWTRQYIVSSVGDLQDLQAASDRLLRNQNDLGDAIAPFFGRDAGAKLTQLLREHILLAGDVVNAAKSGDEERVKKADQKWHDNARDIASFLAEANQFWDKKALNDMLDNHLKLTKDEAVNRIKKDWSADAANFDKIVDQALKMADELTEGIQKKYPGKV